VLVGAGDIASCSVLEGAEATAKLIEKTPGTVFAAGDLAYERGMAAEFRDCYGKTVTGRRGEGSRIGPGRLRVITSTTSAGARLILRIGKERQELRTRATTVSSLGTGM